MLLFLLIFLLLLLYIKIYRQKEKKENNIYGVVACGGIGNKIAGIASSFLISQLSGRYFHGIMILKYISYWKNIGYVL